MSSSDICSTKIIAIPAFNDNYIWALVSPCEKYLALVDPGDADVCINFIKENNLVLSAILITHHHHDHTGGIHALKQFCEEQQSPLTVYAPNNEKILGIDTSVTQADRVNLNAFNLSFEVIELPGHTLDHIAYYANSILFCGDTLFSGGCGRIFEGTPEQMLSSLKKLAKLPPSTSVYCTHEYTLSNLAFACEVEPSNEDLLNYQAEVKKKRSKNEISLPSNIKLELEINPFLRCTQPEIIKTASHYKSMNLCSELATFTAIREWKNNF